MSQDPYELASKLHDRLAATQATANGDKKFLKWKDLSHPGFKGRYNSYMKEFAEAMKELVTDRIVVPEPQQDAPIDQLRRLIFGGERLCYCCSDQFKPSRDGQIACDRCLDP